MEEPSLPGAGSRTVVQARCEPPVLHHPHPGRRSRFGPAPMIASMLKPPSFLTLALRHSSLTPRTLQNPLPYLAAITFWLASVTGY